jgi:hypothetical protein
MPRASAKPAPRSSGGALARAAARVAEFIGGVRNDVQRPYEAGSHTRRTFGWRAPEISPNNAVLFSLDTLRNRSRAAVRNDGYAFGAIDHLVTNIIGVGIKPLSQAKNEALRRQLQELWLAWTDESDADGLLDWYGQQAQAVRAWLEGGEVFLRLRPRIPQRRSVGAAAGAGHRAGTLPAHVQRAAGRTATASARVLSLTDRPPRRVLLLPVTAGDLSTSTGVT